MDGNAVVFVSSISDDSPKGNGILFIGNNGIMFGDVTFRQDITISNNRMLIAFSGTLTVAKEVTLTNNGTIFLGEGASILYGGDTYGIISGNGKIQHSGSLAAENVFDISDGPVSIECGTAADTVKVTYSKGLVKDNILQETQITITGTYYGISDGGDVIYIAPNVTTNIKLNNVNINFNYIGANN